MRHIDTLYIDGRFVTPHGQERAPQSNPATEDQIGAARLGDAEGVDSVVAAAKRAFPALSRSLNDSGSVGGAALSAHPDIETRR